MRLCNEVERMNGEIGSRYRESVQGGTALLTW